MCLCVANNSSGDGQRQQSGRQTSRGVLRSSGTSATRCFSILGVWGPFPPPTPHPISPGLCSKSCSSPFLSVLCLLLPLLRWIRWRWDHLPTEELREKIIWIDKNYNRWKIYCFSRTAPFSQAIFHRQCLSVDCSTPRVWNTRSSPLKMLEGAS